MYKRDIIKRLRDIAGVYGMRFPLLVLDCSDAATEIKRLQTLEAGQNQAVDTLRQLRDFDRVEISALKQKVSHLDRSLREGHEVVGRLVTENAELRDANADQAMLVALTDYVEELEVKSSCGWCDL